jgi:tetratricopeptide (TPR) repeat protein
LAHDCIRRTALILPLAAAFAQLPGPDVARFEAAQKMRDEGRCAEAIPKLKELARAHPAVAAIPLELGRCYFDRKNYPTAEPLFRRAVSLAPESAEVRFFLGSTLGMGGQLPEAIEQLQAATRLDPEFAPAFRVLGMFRIQSGHYLPETRAALETAIRLDPEDGRAEYWLGRYLFKMKESESARTHLERALLLMPKSVQARLAYSLVLSSLGEDERALAEFDRVLASQPRSPEALLGRAKCLYARHQLAPALVAAEKALTTATETDLKRQTLWLLIRLYRELGRTAEAAAAERKLTALIASHDRQQARYLELYEQAQEYHAKHNTQKLVEVLEESLKIQDRQEYLVMLGDAYVELGRIAEAEHCFLRALQSGPESPSIARRLEILRERYKPAK